jgi:CelD/BcsL family acetyltransferase involved in cellulose biosynthesis
MDGRVINSYSLEPPNTAESTGIAERNVRVQVFNSFDELELIQKEWDAFVESAKGEIFLTYDWCRIWWKHYGAERNLRIFVFRCGGDIVGIMPLFIGKIWLGPISIDAVKIVGVDYNLVQFSLPVRYEYIRLVIDEFFRLMSREKWDIIYLGPLSGLYPHTDYLKQAIEASVQEAYRVFLRKKGEHIYYHLADSWEKQLEKVSKSYQKDIIRSHRRLLKNLKNPTGRVETSFATKENFQHYFDEFLEMHQAQWHRIGNAGHFEDWPGAVGYHREMAQKQMQHNRLKLLKVFIGNTCLGYEYDYWFGNRCFELLAGRNEEKVLAGVSVGKINYSEKMHRVVREHISLIDSMRGKYDYKLKLGGRSYPMKSFYIIQKKSSALFRVLLFYILARILHICYYKIWYCRIARILPFKQRSLRRIWIRSVFVGD